MTANVKETYTVSRDFFDAVIEVSEDGDVTISLLEHRPGQCRHVGRGDRAAVARLGSRQLMTLPVEISAEILPYVLVALHTAAVEAALRDDDEALEHLNTVLAKIQEARENG